MTPEEIADRAAGVWERIESAGGTRDTVSLVAVTKTFPADVARCARAAGLVDLGENYAQELEAKAAELTDLDVRWHFIGGLQRNKVKRIAPDVHLWHTVDREALVDEIAKRAAGAGILIQVNTTAEAQKSGCAPDAVDGLMGRAIEAGLDVRGLMTIGPTDGSDPAPAFRSLRRQADELGLRECSMGMTADLEIAVDAGSTMVRVGTALFGPRAKSPK